MTTAMPELEPPFGPRDPGDMAALVAAMPDHIEAALERTARAPWQLPVREPELLAIGGMGGSAIAGELTLGLYADRMPRPALVCRDYRWPACVTPRTLALLSSNSGNTEETLALDASARERGVPRVALTSGGTLAERAARDGVHVQRVPSGMPPRAALFHGWVPVTRLVHALGWADDPEPAWREAAALLRARGAILGPGVPEAANPAKQVARALHGRWPMIYGGRERIAAVALRWRQQLQENAKVLGHSESVPELNHNEIVGWENPAAVHAPLAVVMLRDREDAPEVALRLRLTAEYARRQGAPVHEVESAGESRIARLAALVQLGDYVSLYLGLLNGVDPSSIASIDEFKRRLAEDSARRR